MVALAFAAFDWGLQNRSTSRIAGRVLAIAFYTAINILWRAWFPLR
jgi:hypothetical protein